MELPSLVSAVKCDCYLVCSVLSVSVESTEVGKLEMDIDRNFNYFTLQIAESNNLNN